MRNFEDSLTLKSIDRITSICAPLFANEVKHFTHDITFTNGQISELTTEPAVYETWSQKRHSAIFVNESGRTLDSGIYLGETLSEQDIYCKKMVNTFLPVINCNRLLHIVERNDDCQHTYHLGINYGGDDYYQWLLNKLDFFKKFLNHYKKTAKDLIIEVKKNEHRFVLPIRSEYNEIKKYTPSTTCNDNINKREQISLSHYDSLESITLSKQQSLCFFYLMQGKSAKEIALKMKLSTRTVEHYLETIRKRLGCSTNIELISKYQNQIDLTIA